MNDVYHKEIYTHINGKQYDVVWCYDNDTGSPLEDSDNYGVTERLNWNPTDEGQLDWYIEQHEPSLEEETRLRMLRQLAAPQPCRHDYGHYYDVLSSLHRARTEWGLTKPHEAMRAVEADFKHVYGWYNYHWHWLSLSVAPLDAEGQAMEEHRNYCAGYESTILNDTPDDVAYKRDAIRDQINQIEYNLRKQLNKDQLELAMT